MCVCGGVLLCMCMQYPHSPEEGVEFPGGIIIGSSEPLGIDVGN